MNLGEKLIKLRKEKGLSQEEVSEILDVTRQTVSKWETNMSSPDFDKIVPICKLYNISTEELFMGTKKEGSEKSNKSNNSKKAFGIALGIFIYFISIIWIILSEETFNFNEGITVSVFMLLLGVATSIIVYTCIVYKKDKEINDNSNRKYISKITGIIFILTLIIYFIISFITGAWHITWIIFLIGLLIMEITKLIIIYKEK